MDADVGMGSSGPVITSPRDRGDQQDQPYPGNHYAGENFEPGSEVFCGRIPKEMEEEELRSLFGAFGPVTDVRLTMDPVTNLNKGFAFINFLKEEDASKAIAKLNGKQVRHRQYLKVARCLPNTRLFVGNIPKAMGKEELHREFAERAGGLREVIIYSSPDDEKKNRGFCFLDYESHKAATNAKRRLSTHETKMWGCDILVDWADPQQEVDPDTMSKVRILYVRNIPALVSEDELWALFEAYGPLERVKKIKDFAFIHFATREDASRAKDAVSGMKLRGVPIELQWSKPPTDKETRQQILRAREKRILLQHALRPVRGAVNPFPMAMVPDDEFYPRGDRGDYQNNGGIWSPPSQEPGMWSQEPPPYFSPTTSTFEQDFFEDHLPFTEYPIPQVSSRVFLLDRSDDDEETFSGSVPPRRNGFPSRFGNPRRWPEENWRTNANSATMQRERQWTNQNRGAGKRYDRESDQENWRNRP